ncbi:MAG TPA: glycosyltransferase [Fibrobacteria bacterium]|nr:glycosyltransferase [Fibrobacteria bacterium]
MKRPMEQTSLPSILLVHSPLLGVDLEAAFLEVARVRVVSPQELSVEELSRARRMGVRGVVGVNHAPALALLCREAGMRYVSWTVDPLPVSRWERVPGADTVMFVHRKALVAPLLAMGHPRVEWMPLAAPERRWEEEAVSSTRVAPTFVGSSLEDERNLFLGRLAAWGVSEAAGALDGLFQELCQVARADASFHGFFRDPSLVPRSLAAHLLPAVSIAELAECLDAGLAWAYRRSEVRGWVELGVQVHGDAGWRDLGGSFRGPLRNGQEMTQLYRDTVLNVDVPRLHQREILTLRAIDAMASGGVVAVEAGTELEELFKPGEEFVVVRTPQERSDILERSLRDAAWARRVGLSAREAARSHRLGLRVERILAALE